MRKLLFLSLILIILVTTTGCGILNHQMTGNDVIKAFKQAGLQAENVHPMTTGRIRRGSKSMQWNSIF